MSQPLPGGRYVRDKDTGKVTPAPNEIPAAKASATATSTKKVKPNVAE